MITNNFNKIQEQISLVIDDMQKRYPNCHYTIRILLWEDGTSSIECRHARAEKNDMIICISTYYQNELTYEESIMESHRIKIDGKGNEYYIK